MMYTSYAVAELDAATTGKQHMKTKNKLLKTNSKTKQVDMNKKENVLAHIIMKTALQIKYKTMII